MTAQGLSQELTRRSKDLMFLSISGISVFILLPEGKQKRKKNTAIGITVGQLLATNSPVLDHQPLSPASVFRWTEELEKISAEGTPLGCSCALWGMARRKNQNSSCLRDWDGGKGQLGRATRVADETAG